MPRARNRTEICAKCKMLREVVVNLDTQEVISSTGPKTCPHPRSCIEEMRDKALLSPFEDGKTRRR